MKIKRPARSWFCFAHFIFKNYFFFFKNNKKQKRIRVRLVAVTIILAVYRSILLTFHVRGFSAAGGVSTYYCTYLLAGAFLSSGTDLMALLRSASTTSNDSPCCGMNFPISAGDSSSRRCLKRAVSCWSVAGRKESKKK